MTMTDDMRASIEWCRANGVQQFRGPDYEFTLFQVAPALPDGDTEITKALYREPQTPEELEAILYHSSGA